VQELRKGFATTDRKFVWVDAIDVVDMKRIIGRNVAYVWLMSITREWKDDVARCRMMSLNA
jgi:hypothetical protein